MYRVFLEMLTHLKVVEMVTVTLAKKVDIAEMVR